MTFLHQLKLSAVVAAALLTPQGAFAETLKDALRSAYNHSGLLIQNRALLRAADEDVAQAQALLRPVVSWSAGYNYSSASPDPNSLSASIDLGWTLYDFGRSDLRKNMMKETVLATRQQLISIEQDVLLSATRAFYTHRLNLEIVGLRNANVDLIRKELRAARDRFEVGEITRTDVSLAQARLASAQAAMALAQGNLARSTSEYVKAVGKAPGRLSAPGGGARVPSSTSKAIAVARSTHPTLKRVQHAINIADMGVQIAKLATKPTLSLNAGLSRSDTSGSELNRSIGLNAQGTIYQGGTLASQVRQAVARAEAERANLHIIRHTLDQLVEFAYADLQVSRASNVASNAQVRAAQVAFNGVREEATLGARTTLDVLNAEQELLDARANRIEAQINEQIASFSILAAMGNLTADGLKLGVKTYDPTAYYNLVKDSPSPVSAQGKALDRVLKGLAGN